VISGFRLSRIIVLAVLSVYVALFLVVNQCFRTACRFHYQGVNDPNDDGTDRLS
jgi:ABC-type thiamin/hydroxymethylpyrimidine transport system permease subunit